MLVADHGPYGVCNTLGNHESLAISSCTRCVRSWGGPRTLPSSRQSWGSPPPSAEGRLRLARGAIAPSPPLTGTYVFSRHIASKDTVRSHVRIARFRAPSILNDSHQCDNALQIDDVRNIQAVQPGAKRPAGQELADARAPRRQTTASTLTDRSNTTGARGMWSESRAPFSPSHLAPSLSIFVCSILSKPKRNSTACLCLVCRFHPRSCVFASGGEF